MRLVSAFGLIALLAVPAVPAHAQTGSASWYALDGNRTANGERMNSSKMTAAHRSLPFGTKIKVTNVHNGKSVVVRINDRGPFARNRVLDVSKGAAKELGFVGRGHTTVEIAMVGTGTTVGAAEEYVELESVAVTSPKSRPENTIVALLTSSSVRNSPPPFADSDREPGETRSGSARLKGKDASVQVAFRPLRLNPALAAVFANMNAKSKRTSNEPGV